MSVHVWFSNEVAPLAPGDTLTLTLTVHNLGNERTQCTILPAGLTATWLTISNGHLTLLGASQETVEVVVRPPAVPSTTAGPTTIAVRVIPFGDDEVVAAEATVVIEPFDDLRLVPLQPIQRARHRTNFEIMAENHGNTLASCRMHLVDVTNRLDGDFDPPAVGVAPGEASLILLRARARRGVFRRGTRTLDFEVEAARQAMAPVSTPLSFVQSPTIPQRSIAWLAAILALVAAVVVGWLAVIEPAIEDAVADEVDARIAELAPADASDTSAAASDDVTDTDADDTDPVDTTGSSVPEADAPITDAEPTFFRLPVNAPLTQTADQSITMAAGQVFDMTDVRIENPFNDRGVATLLVNGEPVFIWSLANVRGSYFEPRLTPVRLAAGDNLTFSVRCDEIGDTSRATCTNAINVGGESLPADDL